MTAPIQTVLLTGGTGYIGSHICVALIEAGYQVVILDNLANSAPTVIKRIAQITGKEPAFIKGDIREPRCLQTLFSTHDIHAVIHLAGLKIVSESISAPLTYYENNVSGTLCLLNAMNKANVKHIIFSSSANIYSALTAPPYSESAPVAPLTPYGQSKRMAEQIIQDLCTSSADWKAVMLRYFNPVGAHDSGLIGDNPSAAPTNLLPILSLVAAGQLERLSIFGNTFATPDGTGIRDYIHVVDLALGHVAAIQKMGKLPHGATAINLGTGRGYSVLEALQTFEAASGKRIAYDIAPPRAGDAASSFADVSVANNLLGWNATRTLAQMCEDTWRWQCINTRRHPI